MAISPHTLQSLKLEMIFDNKIIATGTGFMLSHNGRIYLITARHNVTGIDPDTKAYLCKKTGVRPNRIRVHHNYVEIDNTVSIGYMDYDLFEEMDAFLDQKWHDHPVLGEDADIVALECVYNKKLLPMVYDMNAFQQMVVKPGEAISIIGFPFGESSYTNCAIWSTGFIASDLEIDYKDLPMFLVCCYSRKGQSGSPVIAKRYGSFPVKKGIAFTDGVRFLGLYSGRIKAKIAKDKYEETDLGRIWKVKAIYELLQAIP